MLEMINDKRTINNEQPTTKNALFLNIESMKKAFSQLPALNTSKNRA